MKTKITLALDSGLLRDAKLAAGKKGVSLSTVRATCLEQIVFERKARRTYDCARKRALARLRKGMDLNWTPPRSRDELHERECVRRGDSSHQIIFLGSLPRLACSRVVSGHAFRRAAGGHDN
jgi:hypothetical protein